MSRVPVNLPIQDDQGNAIQNAHVHVYAYGTTTPVPVYTAATGGLTLAQPLTTDATGYVRVFCDPADAGMVAVVADDNGGTAYRAYAPDVLVSFPTFTLPFALSTSSIARQPSGPPTSGTHEAGELEVDALGFPWYCTVAGTPGLWVCIASGREIFSVPGVGANTTTSLTAVDLPTTPLAGAVPVLPVPCLLHFHAGGGGSGSATASPANNTAGDGIFATITRVSDGVNLDLDTWISPTANALKGLELWARIPAGTATDTYKVQMGVALGGTGRLAGVAIRPLLFECRTC
jgi:hypothetical protein